MYAVGAYAGCRAAGFSSWIRKYPSGGVGIGLDRYGKNVGKINYNSFKLKSGQPGVPRRIVTRPSFSSETFRIHHWPWN